MVMNPLKLDPSRTTLIRRRFVADMKRRFAAIRRAVYQLVVTDDAFGLSDPSQLQINVERAVWRFQSDPQKINSFKRWLKTQVSKDVLQVSGSGKPWMSEYIESSYKKAQLRSYEDVYGKLADTSLSMESIDSMVGVSLSGPVATKKIELIYTRAFNDLEGVTDAMGQKLSRILANGLSEGRNPRYIARQMTKDIDKLTKTRALVIARTETIAANAESQLDAYDALGIEKVQVMAEWQTAGDNRVCGMCGPMEGDILKVEEARGLIPRHPNCRCAWVPITEPPTNKEDLRRSIKRSVLAEAPKKQKTVKAGKERSTWAGKEKI